MLEMEGPQKDDSTVRMANGFGVEVDLLVSGFVNTAEMFVVVVVVVAVVVDGSATERAADSCRCCSD